MKFIARREDCAGEPSAHKQDRHPSFPASCATQRSPKQRCQDHILAEVPGFADKELHSRDCLSRNIRPKPAQDRANDSGSVLGRHQIG